MRTRFIRIPSRPQSFHLFDTFDGHIYDRHGKTHECMYVAIAKHFEFPVAIKKCSVTGESGKDHPHEPLPRWIYLRILLLWSAQLEFFDWPVLYNGSTGVCVAISKWERVADVSFAYVEEFYKKHKGPLDGFSNFCKKLHPYIYHFHETLCPEKLAITKDFLFNAQPPYWDGGPPAHHPAALPVNKRQTPTPRSDSGKSSGFSPVVVVVVSCSSFCRMFISFLRLCRQWCLHYF